MNPVTSNRIVFILSLAGFGLGVYLSLAHYKLVGLPCTVTHGCEMVNNDAFAEGLGIPFLKAIPTAAFGAAMYLVIAMFSMARAASADCNPKLGRTQWILSGLGLLVFGYLTYREAFVIEAWCQWCLASAFVNVLIFAFLTAELVGGRRNLEGVRA